MTATLDVTLILGLPFSPRLVVINMTPFAPRTPYTAVAEASLRIEIDSISLGSIVLKLGVSIPSTITRGSCKPSPSANVPIPRMRNVDWSFPGSPLLCTANKPGMRPTKELLILACGDCTNSFVDIMEIAPVTVSFF